jgi:hypothetical protein
VPVKDEKSGQGTNGLLIREGLGHNADGRPLVMTPELIFASFL